MRHWTVSLLREGHTSRQWHVWSDVLTVGSHGAAKVRLPLPVEPWALRLTELAEPSQFQVGEYLLLIQDTTTERATLWERAQVRMDTVARQTNPQARPDLHPTPWGTAVLALCLAGLTHWTAEQFASTQTADETSPRPTLQQPGPSAAIAAPQPAAPYASAKVLASQPSGSLTSGIGHGLVPTSVGTSIVVESPHQKSQGGSGGTSDLGKDLAPPAPQHVQSVVSAPWPAAGSRSWESRDQPPPEPPH